MADPLGGGVQPVYLAMPQTVDSGVDLIELWFALWHGKWLIIGTAFILAIAGIVYSLLATPIYYSEVVLAPVTRNQPNGLSDLGGLASLAGIRLSGTADNSQSLAVLQSNNFIAEFIQEKNLLPTLFPDEWDSKNQRWVSNDPERQRDVRDGVKVFVENVRTITEDPKTGLVTLSIEWTDPKTAAEWATDLVNRINEKTRQRDIEESQRKLDYLNKQLADASLVELRLAISRIIEDQISAMMLAQAQVEYAFEIIDPAVVPKQRISPKRTLIVIIATFLGGFLGVFVVLSRYAARKLLKRNDESAGTP